MARLEKNGLYIEAEGVTNERMEAALDAAIAAFGDADRWDSALGAFQFEGAAECDEVPPKGAQKRGQKWWDASGAAFQAIGEGVAGYDFGLIGEPEPDSQAEGTLLQFPSV